MIRVLVMMNAVKVCFGGGITQLILNFRDYLKESEIKMDFAMNVGNDPGLIEELTCYGEGFYYLPDKKRNPFKYIKTVFSICKNGTYDVIHVHGSSATMALELEIAKRASIKNRIVHCHNTRSRYPILNMLLRPWFQRTYNRSLACSKAAGNWLFGEDNFIVLHNAIDLDRFAFSEVYRLVGRKEIKIPADYFVLGHVGNFNEQKNHEFIIEVFHELQKRKQAKLLLIGDGERKNRIQLMCKKLGILHHVYFLGRRDDVEKWLSVMDAFIFPSKWEGLGMVAIEAQVSGLPVLASENVPQEACLTEKMRFLDLKQGIQGWVELILKVSDNNDNRQIKKERFSDYDITVEKDKLLELYMHK